MDWEDFGWFDLEALAAPEILERGIDYYRQGHLITAGRIEGVLAGEVIGTAGNYQVRLWIEDSKIQSHCSCPYTSFCKHSVALAFGWLENRAAFTDIRPFLDKALQDPAELPNHFQRMVYQNPLSFMRLFDKDLSKTKAVSPREMISLVRNIFQTVSGNRFNNLEVLWDKIAGVEKLLTKELLAGNQDAIRLLAEILQGIYIIYKDHTLPEMTGYFRDTILLTGNTAGHFGKDDLRELCQTVVKFYFDPGLWEFKRELKQTIFHLCEIDPDFVPNYLAEHIRDEDDSDSNNDNILELISFYELLAVEPAGLPVFDWQTSHYFEIITRKLNATGEGRLWLIDRFLSTDLEEAYRLTKTTLISGMEPKRSFRDRLIRIHWQRNEFKQAASLSFIQFQEEPNFEEYLRLKKILVNYPSDFQNYLKRLGIFLTNLENETLVLKIAIDQGNYIEVLKRLEPAREEPSLLLTVADLLIENGSNENVAVYPGIIKMLLAEKVISFWNKALRMTATYKKLCYQSGQYEAWEGFRNQLSEEYPDDLRFHRKFGSILAG
jgi:hypothetical protein